MGKSIMQEDRECFISGYTGALDKHHIYAGSCRKASEKYGCWVWLRHDIHMELHDRNKTSRNCFIPSVLLYFMQSYANRKIRTGKKIIPLNRVLIVIANAKANRIELPVLRLFLTGCLCI